MRCLGFHLIMPEKEEIWNRITERFGSKLERSDHSLWFAGSSIRALDRQRVVIEVPNRFFQGWLEENYLAQIQEAFEEALHFRPEVRFVYPDSPSGRDPGLADRSDAVSTLRSGALDRSLTFETFVVGKYNKFSYLSALEAAGGQSTPYNPLYIFGKGSNGKSHLLNAIAHQRLVDNPLSRVKYTSTEALSLEFFHALREKTLDNFRRLHGQLDLFLVDDVHLLGGKLKLQEELVGLFDALYERGTWIAVAGKRPPNLVQTLIDPLRSRFQWGILTEMGVPDQETKLKVIQQEASRQGLEIADDVVLFLANGTDNMKALHQSIVRLCGYSSLSGQRIDIFTAKAILRGRRSQRPGAEEIQKVTARYFDVTAQDLISGQKSRKICYPRQIAMYLCRELTGLSYKGIGEAFGSKNHSTVIYGTRRIQAEKDKKAESVLKDLNRLFALLA
jgi:chromosomal replication initiator protein